MVKPSVLQRKAGDRVIMFSDVKRGLITLKQASEMLKISYRQAKRLWKKFKLGGPMALLPKKRSKAPWNKTPVGLKLRVISFKKQYPEVNCAHLADLFREEGIEICRETVRRILSQAQLHFPHQKHKRRPRKRFEAEKAGKLVQIDTSPFHWIPAINKELKLILDFDDHSRKPLVGRLAEHDTTWENMCLLRKTVERYGLFEALYADNDTKFKYERINESLYFNYQKQSAEVQTQIRQVLDELGIRLINTHKQAPHEKGKIERFFGFLQQRLPIEFKLHNITTIEAANKYLAQWLDRHGSRWMHKTTGMIPDERFKNSCFKPLPAGIDLDHIFCLRAKRKVKKDNTFTYKGRVFQLTDFRYRAYWGNTELLLKIVPKKQISVFYDDKFIQKFPYDGE